jgi:hypothetical protein
LVVEIDIDINKIDQCRVFARREMRCKNVLVAAKMPRNMGVVMIA